MLIAVLLKLIFDAPRRQYQEYEQQGERGGKKKKNMTVGHYLRSCAVANTLAYLFI